MPVLLRVVGFFRKIVVIFVCAENLLTYSVIYLPISWVLWPAERSEGLGAFPSSGYLALYQMVVFGVFDENLFMTSSLVLLLSANLAPHLHLVYQLFRSTLGLEKV